MDVSAVGGGSSLFRARRRWLAVAVWLAGLALLVAMALWNLSSEKRNAESRLTSEAGRTAAQLASLLALTGQEPDEKSAHAVALGAMEDDRIYAVKVETRNGLVEGERRNYLWEPVPWDDEITENCVQGANMIKIGGQNVGNVDVWLSPRLNEEENSLLASREFARFAMVGGLWTAALLLVFWQWGDLRRLRRYFSAGAQDDDTKAANISENMFADSNNLHDRSNSGIDEIEDTSCGIGEAGKVSVGSSGSADAPVVDAEAGRRYQRRTPEAWLVTAGMFRQTFARGPALISRLYSEGEVAGLCHLGRMLEQAAPCIGAQRLFSAAKAMQAALNDPECKAGALPVEECARALEEVLDSLCGNGQWRSRPHRS